MSWQRSKKGNLWRKAGRLTVSVFQRKDESFGWCIADHEGPQYSKDDWPSEQEAVRAAEWEVERREIAIEALL